MRRFKWFMVAVMCVFLVGATCAYASSNRYSDGKTTETKSGIWTFTATDTPYEVVITDEVLVAADSGHSIIVRSPSATAVDVTLPTGVAGMEYNIIVGGAYTGGALAQVKVGPADADTIAFLTLDAGDELDSPGTVATGDSVTLVCGAANTWYVKNMKGSWSDGGAT